MKCFNEKNQHIGNLKTIIRFTVDSICDVEAVVNWCPKCGAIVVDKEVDGRLMNSRVKMQFPNITREALKK